MKICMKKVNNSESIERKQNNKERVKEILLNIG